MGFKVYGLQFWDEAVEFRFYGSRACPVGFGLSYPLGS